ncbi:MAG TPA: hypothetical protein VK014_11080 [Cyclobacteriaceae bacterium]|nr:hypothetical protein [Cyclobacteriaceae bacterium]
MTSSKLSKILALPALLFCFALGAMAQGQPSSPPQVKEDFTDEQFETFIKINMDIMPIQQAAEGDMMKAIADKGMDVQRFQELAQAQQTGKLTEVSQDPEEINAFNLAGQEVLEVQKKVQEQIKQKIEENNMDIQTFQDIYIAYDQSQTVREKIDKLLERQEAPEQP